MPAVAIVVDVIASDVIGATIATAVTDVVGSAIVGDIVSGAVIGAIGGATSAAVQGGNIWKGAEKGAESGAVSGGVQGALQGAELTGKGTSGGALDLTKTGLSSQAASALAKGLGTAAGAAATGTPLKSSLESGAISGGLDYLFAPAPGTTQSESQKILSGIEKGFASTALSQLLGGSSPKSQPKLGGAPVTGQASLTSASPGSQALGQALNIGDAGSPVLGGGDTSGRKNVWNVESLRYMGNPPSESSSG